MIRAVLFDVDGTLYHQAPLRILMAAELASAPWVGHAPWKVPRLWRMLAAFRHVREELRALGRPDEPLARLQYTRAADRAGVPVEDMEAAVDEWIYKRPLKYSASGGPEWHGRGAVRPGCARICGWVPSRTIRWPTNSTPWDCDASIALELDATAEAINAFKPHPRGLEVACERWGLAPDQVLYVGDRADVDALGAAHAGMPCAIVGAAPVTGQAGSWPYTPIARMRDLLAHMDRLMGAC